MSGLIGVQRRLVELGRIRLGEKGTRGEPKRLNHFRLTSASRPLLEAAARLYGGTVRAWQGAPDDGMWELLTTTDALDVMVPPVITAYSQLYEVWDAGGCTLRCDGRWESIAERDCDHGDHEGMKVTTRVSVILPKLPGLGTWRLETHGWNAAATLPATLDLLISSGRHGWLPAVLRLEQRSSRTRDDKGKVLVRRFVVPVLDIVGATFEQLLAMGQADAEIAIEEPVESPALPAKAGPSRPPRNQRVARPELAPEPELPAIAAPFAGPIERSFPEEAPADEPKRTPTETVEARVVSDEAGEETFDLVEAIRAAATVSDHEGPATKDDLMALGRAFTGWDPPVVKTGLRIIWDRDAIAHPTAAQAHALVVTADSLGDKFAPLWMGMLAADAVPA